MIFIKKYHIRIYVHENGKAPYSEWIKSLDGFARARINARIARFEDGFFGDHKSVGVGLLEARFFFGPGYRVYFAVQRQQIILLLTAGDKSTQGRDIANAKLFLKSYLEDKNANKKS